MDNELMKSGEVLLYSDGSGKEFVMGTKHPNYRDFLGRYQK